ncbi:MAG: hypothetical protein JSW10_05950 [Pseudomonadota bacterium]|nr:MAG: hypothetical protein JSW10_05950 [Pseudomonadota bacterium]
MNQALTIPANTAHLAFQDGKVVPRGSMSQVDQYHVNCRFEVKTLSDTSQQIAADTFDIIKVQDLTTGATGYSTHNFATRLMLSSSAQPDVYQMTCQQWSDASELDYPSIALMEKAWGDAFTLQLRP